MGGLARRIPITFVTFAIATGAIAGLPPLAGFFSKDEILWFAFASGGVNAAVCDGGNRAADRGLYVPSAVADVLRCLAHGCGHRASRARIAVVDDRNTDRAGCTVDCRRLHCRTPFLEPLLPLPVVEPAMQRFHTVILVASIALRLAVLRLRRFYSAATRTARGDTSSICPAESTAIGQVLHRRDLRRTDRTAAVLDFRPCIPAARRSCS